MEIEPETTPASAPGTARAKPDAGAADASGEARLGPLVSLGLPVYNGANYLRAALDSILAQTYARWELILSDNGSSDGTQDICAEYAARDGRIRFYRHPVNMGAARNFNFTFALARGPLFRWTAHDDVCAPELLERCVAAMLAHPEAVLVHPRTRVIGPDGAALYDDPVRLDTGSPLAERRFHDLTCLDHSCFQVFGLMRTAQLRRTPLLGAFVGADRNLLAELALIGPFHEIPEVLFFRRDHPNTSTRQFPGAKERLAWFREAPVGARHPTLRRAAGYLASILRVPLTARERLGCLAVLLKWCGQRALSFLNGLRLAAASVVAAWKARRRERDARLGAGGPWIASTAPAPAASAPASPLAVLASGASRREGEARDLA